MLKHLDKLPDDLCASAQMQKLQQKQVMKKLQRLTKEAILHQKWRGKTRDYPNKSQAGETPKPVETPKADTKPAETATPAAKPAEKQIEDREDVNHLGRTAQASKTMRLVPTLLQIRLSMEITILVGVTDKMYLKTSTFETRILAKDYLWSNM